MAEIRSCFTFIWKINNFGFCLSKSGVISPYFFVHVLEGAKCHLELRSNPLDAEDCVACYIHYGFSNFPSDQLQFDFEFSFLGADGSVLQTKIFPKNLLHYYSTVGGELHVKNCEIFSVKKDRFIPDDTLTIRFRMWDSQNSIILAGNCVAETFIVTRFKSFEGNIENLSCLSLKTKYPVITAVSDRREVAFLSSTNLCVAADGKLAVEIKLKDKKCKYRCEIFIRNIFCKEWKCGESEFYNTNSLYIPLALSKEYLMENKRYFFPRNVLSLDYEITCPLDITEQDEFQKPKYEFDCPDTKKISNVTKTSFTSEEHASETSVALKAELNSLYKDGILCDTKLKTATETFPAHITVLSARSPVFKSMFSTDMKEKTNNCVEIDDLDADTVRRMLHFMYTDTLDDLDYEIAKRLYTAADKYNIVLLTRMCSNFLKKYLLPSNCCPILLLADYHQDEDLKYAVQDYIAKNDEMVLLSNEWNNLEKNHSQLAIEVFRIIYNKNRRI